MDILILKDFISGGGDIKFKKGEVYFDAKGFSYAYSLYKEHKNVFINKNRAEAGEIKVFERYIDFNEEID